MATTTTGAVTGIIGGTAGLGLATGLAVAGAVGLGVLGLAVLAHRGGDDDKKSYHRKPHYGTQSHYHKRSASEQSNAFNNIMSLIRQEDITGCGLRLMCELAADKEEELTEEELAILNLVGPVVKPGEGVLPPGGVGDYTMAKSLGRNGANCGQEFPMCALNGTQLMDTVMAFLP